LTLSRTYRGNTKRRLSGIIVPQGELVNFDNVDVKADGSYSKILADGNSAITGRISSFMDFAFDPSGNSLSGVYIKAVPGTTHHWVNIGTTGLFATPSDANPLALLMAYEADRDSSYERIEAGGDKAAHLNRGKDLDDRLTIEQDSDNTGAFSGSGDVRLYADRPGGESTTAAQTTCTGKNCSVRSVSGMQPAAFFSLGDYGPVDSEPDDVLMVMTKNDIALALDRTPGRSVLGATPALRSFGAWMDHAGFFVTTGGTYGSGDDKRSARMVSAAGERTASKPATNATWRGSMVGTVTQGEARDHTLRGEAELTFNLNRSTVDAQFFNIKDFDRFGAPHLVATAVKGRQKQSNSIRFDKIPVARDGSYEKTSAEHDGGNIRGAFYGEGHAETAGTFDVYNIIGSFGAKRVLPPAREGAGSQTVSLGTMIDIGTITRSGDIAASRPPMYRPL